MHTLLRIRCSTLEPFLCVVPDTYTSTGDADAHAEETENIVIAECLFDENQNKCDIVINPAFEQQVIKHNTEKVNHTCLKCDFIFKILFLYCRI